MKITIPSPEYYSTAAVTTNFPYTIVDTVSSEITTFISFANVIPSTAPDLTNTKYPITHFSDANYFITSFTLNIKTTFTATPIGSTTAVRTASSSLVPTTTSKIVTIMFNVSSTEDIVSVHPSSSDKAAAITHSKNTASLFLSLPSSSENLSSKTVIDGAFNSANISSSSQTTATVGSRIETTATAGPRIETTATAGPRIETTATAGPRIETTATVGSRIETIATAGPRIETTATAGSRIETITTAGSRVETTATVFSSSDIDSSLSSDTIANRRNDPILTVTADITLSTSVIISSSSETTVSTGEIIACINILLRC